MKISMSKNRFTWFKEKGCKAFLLFMLLLLCGGMTYKYQDGVYRKNASQTDLKVQNDMTYHQKPQTEKKDVADLQLYARAAALLDGETGRVLYEKEGYEVMPMASTTKIMTCMLALEYGKEHPLKEEWVEVSSYAASQPKVKAGLKTGEKYLLSDLLYSMMLESHNDTAVAIAEHIGRDYVSGLPATDKEESKKYVKAFTDRMDQKAEKLGCLHTNFVTPNGLDAQDEDGPHETNAVELGKITTYAMQNEAFCKIIQTPEYLFSNQQGTRNIHVYNKDAYLTLEEGACGVKTGFTNQAGYCFVGARKCDGNLFISVVLGCGWPPEKSKKWSDTRKIMALAKDNYKRQRITYHPFEQYLEVRGGIKNYCKVSSEQEEAQDLLLAPWESVTMTQYQDVVLQAPVQKGDIVGYQIYQINNEKWKEVPIRAKESINASTIWHCIEKITKLWLL